MRVFRTVFDPEQDSISASSCPISSSVTFSHKERNLNPFLEIL